MRTASGLAKNSLRIMVLVFGMVLLSAPANADDESVRRWFNDEWARCDAPLSFGNVGLRWEVIRRPPTEEQRREYMRRYGVSDVKFGDGRTVTTMWINGAGHWRRNVETPGPGYMDTVVTPRHAWRLTPHVLVVSDPEGTPGGTMYPQQEGRSYLREPTQFVNGGLTLAKRSKFEVRSIKVDGDRWRVTLSRGPLGEERAMVREVEGRWDAAAGRGFVERTVTTRHPMMPGGVGGSAIFRDWRYVDALGCWIAHEFEELEPDGTRERLVRFLGPVTDYTLAEVAGEPPSHDGVDAVRGRATFVQLRDERAGRVARLDPESREETGARFIERHEERPWLRWTGWLCAASLTAGLVVFALKRHFFEAN